MSLSNATPLIDLGRDLCSNLSVSGAREWLVTNGIGGFAAGTVAGIHTRRYHGLLIAALKPPWGRTLLSTKIENSSRKGSAWSWLGYCYARSADPFLEEFSGTDLLHTP